jgi:hypothetical protein
MHAVALSGVVIGSSQCAYRGGADNPERVVDPVDWEKSSKERCVDRIGEHTQAYAEGYSG